MTFKNPTSPSHDSDFYASLFLGFPDFEKRYAVRSVLTWSHYRLKKRVDTLADRDYSLREAELIAELEREQLFLSIRKEQP